MLYVVKISDHGTDAIMYMVKWVMRDGRSEQADETRASDSNKTNQPDRLG